MEEKNFGRRIFKGHLRDVFGMTREEAEYKAGLVSQFFDNVEEEVQLLKVGEEILETASEFAKYEYYIKSAIGDFNSIRRSLLAEIADVYILAWQFFMSKDFSAKLDMGFITTIVINAKRIGDRSYFFTSGKVQRGFYCGVPAEV